MPTKSVEDVDHACDPGVFAERHDAVALLVHQLLVINQPDVLLQNGVEQRHVDLLRLNRVREKTIGPIRKQLVDRNLKKYRGR